MAACIRTRCPGCTMAAALRQASAVRKTVGTVEAASAVRFGGMGTTVWCVTITEVAKQPPACPKTESPTLKRITELAVSALKVQDGGLHRVLTHDSHLLQQL